MESPRSPKRRRILSSINPPEPGLEDDAPRSHKRHRTATPDIAAPQADDAGAKEDTAQDKFEPQDGSAAAPRPTKFRFKDKSSSRSSRRRERGEEDDDDDDRRRRHRHRSQSRSRSQSPSRDRDRRGGSRERDNATQRQQHDDTGRHRHRHHHRRRRRHHHRSRPQSPPPETDEPPNPFQDPPLSPTTAFRESLFDAMADDEGAAYWESVYGQPIHIYTNPPGGNPSAGGTLERMTDDEYAAYVRQKMWEKTHAGLLEARARREQEREAARRRADEKARVAREMERCLRRGEERRRRKGWRERWEAYVGMWADWDRRGEGGAMGVEGIPWPDGAGPGAGPGDGDGMEVRGETVRAFFVNGIGLEEVGEREFAARLKEERVRWHPDKMQQRLGGKVDEKVMRDVTAIFQVVDALWNDTRKSGG